MKAIGILCIALTLIGCASYGVQVKTEQLSSFKRGETTIEEVIAKLGKPTTISTKMDGTKEIAYIYSHAQARPETFIPYVGVFVGGVDARSSSVILTFDAEGKLTNFTSSEGQMGMSTGITGGYQERTNQPRAAE
jgi:hypothetical protein